MGDGNYTWIIVIRRKTGPLHNTKTIHSSRIQAGEAGFALTERDGGTHRLPEPKGTGGANKKSPKGLAVRTKGSTQDNTLRGERKSEGKSDQPT